MHGNRLRELRHQAGLSMRALGAELGVDHTAVLRYENGRTDIPTRFLGQLADRFGVTIDHLLGRDERQQEAA